MAVFIRVEIKNLLIFLKIKGSLKRCTRIDQNYCCQVGQVKIVTNRQRVFVDE